ncbi:hypothetical protein KI387_004924, partial [Taxus chinensis]
MQAQLCNVYCHLFTLDIFREGLVCSSRFQKYLVICKCVLFGVAEECYDKDEQQAVGFSEASSTENIQVPNDFKCPISLDMMRDPAIVATGQTYDRVSITRWIEEGHCTCPKSGQKLLHTNLIPNHALRSLICQWCEKNDIPFEKPKSIPSLVPSMYTLLIYRETSPQITYTLVMEMQLIMSVCESVVCTIDMVVYKDIPAIVREANASPLGEDGLGLMGCFGNHVWGRSSAFVESMCRLPGGLDQLLSQQTRTFIQMRTSLKVVDNSGAKRVMCIQALKSRRGARLGDTIIASVKEAHARGKVKKGDVVYCVVVRAAMQRLRCDGSQIRFDDNAVVLV